MKDLKSFLKRTKGYFDWYIGLTELLFYFQKFEISKESSILIAGCGNSKLSNQLIAKGYKNITNFDLSSVCIEKMKD